MQLLKSIIGPQAIEIRTMAKPNFLIVSLTKNSDAFFFCVILALTFSNSQTKTFKFSFVTEKSYESVSISYFKASSKE